MAGEISKLRIGFQLDSSQLEKGMGFVLSNLNLMQKEFKSTMAGVDKYNKSLDDLGKEAEGLKGILNQQKVALSSVQAEYDKVAKAKGEDSKEAFKLRAKYIDLTTQIQNTEKNLTKVTGQMAEQEKANNKLRKAYTTLNNGLKDTSKSMITLGNSMTRVSANVVKATARIGVATGTTLAVGLGIAVKKAADFEQGLSNVGAVSNATEGQMKKLHDQALELGASTKYSATEVTQAQEELVKAGLSVNQVLRDGEAALNLATAGDLDLAKAAEIAGVAINSFKSEGLDLTHVANKMAGAANASATSVEEMQFGMSMSAAVASGLGVSFDDLNTSLAVFANNGLKSSDAGTSLKTLLMNLSPISDDAYNQMQDLGIITYDAARAMQTMSEMGLKPASSSFDDVRKSVEKYLIETEGLKAGSSGLKKETDKLMMSQGFMSNKFFDANGNVRTQAEIAQVLQDSMKGLTKEQQTVAQKIMFGTDAVRASNIMVREGGKGYAEMNKEIGKTTAQEVATKKLDNLKGSIENLKGGLETLAISVGEKLIPIIKKWVDTINKNMPEIQKKVGAFVDKIMEIDWQKIMSDIVSFAKAVFPPLIEGFKNVANFLKNMDDNTKKIVATLGILAIAVGPILTVIGTLGTVIGVLLNPITWITVSITALAAGVIWAATHFKEFTKLLHKLGEFFGNAFADVIVSTGEFFVNLGKFFGEAWFDILSGVQKFFQRLGTSFFKAFSDLLMSTARFFGSIGLKVDAIASKIAGGFRIAWGKVKEVFGGITGWFTEKWDAVINGIATFATNIESKISGIVDKIKKPFEELSLFSIGEDIIKGLGKGISGMGKWIKEKIESIGKKIPEWLQKLLKIQSPSRVLADKVGQHIPTGIVMGIESSMPKLEQATMNMGLATIPNLQNVSVPQSARSGVYGNQTTNNFSPTVNLNANSPHHYVQQTERMIRRMNFQRGI